MHRNTAQFRFYEELNDFLPPGKKKTAVPYHFSGSPSIKDAIEAIGVPHPEVELILVNGVSVGFDYRLQNGDHVSVYPVFESLDVSPLIRLRGAPLRRVAFVLDVHLGKLAKLLRMLGFDTEYRNDYGDAEIIELAVNDKRIVLTRDRGILKTKSVTHGYWIRSSDPEEQVREVIARFDLRALVKPFHRCMACNGILEEVEKSAIRDRLPPRPARYFDEFYQCLDCEKVYWKGSHYDNMNMCVQEILRYGNLKNRRGKQ
ncbi:MAG: Mut7-C ubiquitin/RNAse domain-containing protein [Candidatus Latescibacterota bacterium]|nr:MAG: Mut7-C ubiquitin/RNAse domain-containing protein [Candidatus Latescibacterota bacterium]